MIIGKISTAHVREELKCPNNNFTTLQGEEWSGGLLTLKSWHVAPHPSFYKVVKHTLWCGWYHLHLSDTDRAANGDAHAAHTCEDAALTGNGFVWDRFLPNQVPVVLVDRDGLEKKKTLVSIYRKPQRKPPWPRANEQHCVPDHTDVVIFLADTWSDGVVLLKTPRSGHNTTHEHILEIIFFSYNFITFQHWK